MVSPPTTQEAHVGMDLNQGDQLRTGSRSRAQIQQADGVFVRISSNSVLAIEPNLKLVFNQGQMITWVERPTPSQVEIVTPFAVAAIQGTTVFVEVPDHGRWARFFSWEGTVRVALPDQSDSITLTSGESVLIPAGSRHLPPPYRPDSEMLRQRFANSTLIHDFRSPMGTLAKIEAVVTP
ncbi:MAG: hypothetical protein OHK0012_17090 [Synechococcales cyanobacterium]